MLGKITSLIILALLLSQGIISSSGKAPPYEDQEAYDVYSAILPLEWPLRNAHAKRLIIQNETKGFEMCLRPEKEWQEKIGPAISDYVRSNAKPSLLQPRIQVGVPYQLIAADELTAAIQTAGWEGLRFSRPREERWKMGCPRLEGIKLCMGVLSRPTNVPRARLLGDVHLLPSTCCYIELQSRRIA